MEDDVHPKYFVASGQLACTLHNIFNRGLAADRNTPLKTMYNAVKYCHNPNSTSSQLKSWV